jgi:hypothetical protein
MNPTLPKFTLPLHGNLRTYDIFLEKLNFTFSVENGTITDGARTSVPQISSFTLYHCAALAHVPEAKFLISKKVFCH